MRRGVVLPGSTLGEEESVATAAGRLSAEDVITLTQVAAWWRYRLERADASDPVASLIGGVDAKATTTTSDLGGGLLTLTPALFVPPNTGRALLLHAYGHSTNLYPPSVYSLLAVAHCYNGPIGATVEANRVSYMPSGATSLDLQAALTPGTNALVLSIVGLTGVTIEWMADVYWLG